MAYMNKVMLIGNVGRNQHWCMCTQLKNVARDGKSTCSICGGRDAYGLSTERPEDKKKTITNQTKE